MINVTLIYVGKLKEKYLRDGCDEYIKRIGAFCSLNMVEINEEKISDNPSPAQIETVIQKEGERILAKIPSGAYVVPMCIEGKQLSSEELSQMIEKNSVQGTSRFVFIIGGSYGLSDEVKKRASFKLSMSKMTFPHQLARMMLLEQLYRAFSISNNGKYHK